MRGHWIILTEVNNAVGRIEHKSLTQFYKGYTQHGLIGHAGDCYNVRFVRHDAQQKDNGPPEPTPNKEIP